MPTVVITGGAQGIGKITALRLIEAGWSAALLDSDEEALRELASERRLPEDRLLPLPCDVADEKEIEIACCRIKEAFQWIDGLVNNAAVSANRHIRELTREAWDRVLAVNLTAPYLLTRHALPLFRDGKGAIVNLCSTRALMSEPNTEAYSASKGGVVALTHALSMSLGPHIRVNAVSPGWIDTTGDRKRSARTKAVLSAADHAQHPVGRVGKPDDVAAMVQYLLSEQAGFVTGQNFVVDGGMTRKMIYV